MKNFANFENVKRDLKALGKKVRQLPEYSYKEMTTKGRRKVEILNF